MEPKTVIFIGPQGSGKGTQLERLRATLQQMSKEIPVTIIQTGSLFRDLALETSFTGQKLNKTLNTGILLPLFLTIGLWANDMIRRMDNTSHVLIDGTPRTEREAEVLVSALTFYERTPVDIIALEAPEAVVRERMKQRAREDDTEESIEKRLLWYKTETDALHAYVKTLADYRVHTISALDPIEVVEANIHRALLLSKKH